VEFRDGFYCCVGQNSSDFMWTRDARRRYEISNDDVGIPTNGTPTRKNHDDFIWDIK
jgi:hypothetical protein